MIRTKPFSRLLVVFLVLALTFTMSVPAFGESENLPDGNITVVENLELTEGQYRNQARRGFKWW